MLEHARPAALDGDRPLFGGDPPRPKPKKARKKKQSAGAVLNSISFVTGPLGCGKSYFAVKNVVEYGAAGKIIACNFDLQGGWWEVMRRHSKEASKLEGEEARAWGRECRSRVYRFDQMEDLYEFALPGKGEGRGLLVLDEGGLNLNSRLYQLRQKKDAAATDGKNPIRALQFYINMRKRGWTCLILSHSAQHLDNQVQDMGGGLIKLRNFARVKAPLVGISLAKEPRFYARYFTPDISGTVPEYRQMYGLDKGIASIYKSEAEFDFMPEGEGLRLQADPDRIARPADGLPTPIPCGVGERPVARAPGPPHPARELRWKGLRRALRRVLVRDGS